MRDFHGRAYLPLCHCRHEQTTLLYFYFFLRQPSTIFSCSLWLADGHINFYKAETSTRVSVGQPIKQMPWVFRIKHVIKYKRSPTD